MSPPSTPLERQKDDAWDLLYAAAEHVTRLSRLNDQGNHHGYQGSGLLWKPSPPVSAASKAPGTGYYHTPALTQHQQQLCHLKQPQLMKRQLSAAWGRQSRARGGGGGHGGEGRYGRPLGLPSSAWPPLQKHRQQPQLGSSGMRAVFLTGAGAKRESAGTGVFLPRRVGTPTESRKKPDVLGQANTAFSQRNRNHFRPPAAGRYEP
ncbi:hypothetical protein COCNU_scaffold010294G000080 [Cocos nucifera]|nr:hypothetical protein [Cocos nucifera]